MKLVSRRLEYHVSSVAFSRVYNRRVTACDTWVISHVFQADQHPHFGALHCFRPRDGRTFIFPLNVLLGEYVELVEQLRLLCAAGSLFLFRIRNPNDGVIRLLMVDVFSRILFFIPPVPPVLNFSVRRHIQTLIDPVGGLEFCIDYMQLMGEKEEEEEVIPCYAGYRFGLDEWTDVLLADENEMIAFDDPRSMLLSNRDVTYFVSFLNGVPVFKVVETDDLVNLNPIAIHAAPRPNGWGSLITVDFSRAGQGYLIVVMKHVDPEDPAISELSQLFLYQMQPNLSGYQLLSTFPPDRLPLFHFQYFMLKSLEVTRNGKVNFALSTFHEAGCGYMLFGYDLGTGIWDEVLIPYDGADRCVSPVFTSGLTIGRLIDEMEE